MTGTAAAPSAPSAFAELALSKLTRVLGNERGQRVFRHTLTASGLTDIRTADELFAFAGHLSKRTDFEAAVGALLSVAAVVRGARGDRS